MAAGTTLDSRLTKKCSGWMGGLCDDSKTSLGLYARRTLKTSALTNVLCIFGFFERINCSFENLILHSDKMDNNDNVYKW